MNRRSFTKTIILAGLTPKWLSAIMAFKDRKPELPTCTDQEWENAKGGITFPHGINTEIIHSIAERLEGHVVIRGNQIRIIEKSMVYQVGYSEVPKFSIAIPLKDLGYATGDSVCHSWVTP